MGQNKKILWTGRILTAFGGLFMIFDAVIHIANPSFVVSSFVGLGYNPAVAVPLGIVELICLVLYFIPRTSIFGAVLLTGYLGGAVATNVRVGTPLFTNILFPVYIAILLWGGLYGRDERLRALIPLKKA